MKLTLAYSPCPNDCFMFDAMVHGRIDTEGLEFAVTLADIEALNLGVCGSFRPALAPGAVVHVTADRLAELGAEDGDGFLTIHQLQLLGENEFPFEGGLLVNAAPPPLAPLSALRGVTGITVNTVHGSEPTIAAIRTRYDPDVESMEGAAFMYASLIAGVPFAQVRAVSNAVERRNRGAWRLDQAIKALGAESVRLLESL